jgi:hypothetical protein
MSAVTVVGNAPLSVLSPAVMRSVSVTDFLSSLADRVTRGFSALSQSAERGGHTIATATVIAGFRRNGKPSVHKFEHLKKRVVLVSAQLKTLRLLDESENNPHPGRKQETA